MKDWKKIAYVAVPLIGLAALAKAKPEERPDRIEIPDRYYESPNYGKFGFKNVVVQFDDAAQQVTITGTAEITNPANCPGCIRQLLLVAKNPRKVYACIYSGIPPVKAPLQRHFTLRLPYTEKYPIALASDFNWSCSHARSRYLEKGLPNVEIIDLGRYL